jgi:hypothetical protein
MMMAMDVVDTLRHQAHVVERELNTETNDAALLERLHQIYASQGIEVPDAILLEGVHALRKDRFVYTPSGGGLQRWLAEKYATRNRWGKWFLVVCAALVILWLTHYFFDTLPEQRARAMLPQSIERTYADISSTASDPAVAGRAEPLREQGLRAVDAGDLAAAERSLAELSALQSQLEQAFELRIVNNPDQSSGVWRVPDVNTNARNYYLIVQAIDRKGQPVQVPIRNEENNRISSVDTWGVRVDRAVFEGFVADKQADGIIDNPVIGEKQRGKLDIEYRVSTTGGAITQW